MHDLAVIGLGALGVHVAREAARRGLDVVGLETGDGGHEHAATGGRTRIFRMVYTFGSDYVPALRRSRLAWDALAADHPDTRHAGGALLIGAPDDPEMVQAREAVQVHGLDHELLGADELAERWPQHRLLPGDVALHDPAGALLVPPRVTAAVAEQARAAGARLRHGVTVTGWNEVAGGLVLSTGDGEPVPAREVVVAAGAWSGRLVPAFDAAVELRRAVLHWYGTGADPAFGPQRFPVGLRRSGATRYSFFPQLDGAGVKVNFHAPKPRATSPDVVAEDLPADLAELEAGLHATLPGLGERTGSASYVESYTPDYRVLLGPVPEQPRVWLLAGGSGQAFKLAPALAEHLVQRLLGEQPTLTLRGVARELTQAPATSVVGP